MDDSGVLLYGSAERCLVTQIIAPPVKMAMALAQVPLELQHKHLQSHTR
jgi:hypothetical protein